MKIKDIIIESSISEIKVNKSTKKDSSDRYDFDEYIGETKPIGKINGYEIHHGKKEHRSEDESYFLIKDPDSEGFLGGLKLFMDHRSKYWFSQVFFDPEIQGKGLAVPLYKLAINKGYTIVSDKTQTKGSRTLWAKLAKQPGVHVYAWDTAKNKYNHWDADVDAEEEMYFDNEKTKKRFDDLSDMLYNLKVKNRDNEIDPDDFEDQQARIYKEMQAIDDEAGQADDMRLVATKE